MFENVKIARDLEGLLRSQSALATVEITEVLKGGAKNHVCIAQINGQTVVVKRFLEAGAAQTVRSLEAELLFVAKQFGTGRNRINECLFAFPDIGVAVLSFAPGARLGATLMTSKGRERAELMQHSGEWLGDYTATRRRVGSFAPQHWLRQLSKMGTGRAVDQCLLDGLRESLETQATSLQGAPITHAATHGDFVSLNAHYHEGVIYGVDIQGESWLPLVKDIAGFLVWEGLRRGPCSDDLWLGLMREDITSFLRGVNLPEDEHATVLPFMIGVQIYRRVIERSRAERGMDYVAQSVENYISTTLALGGA